jgi:hypothetical protein
MTDHADSKSVYHGTDPQSSRSIETIGCNLAAMRAAAGLAGADETGFGLTRDPAVAAAWTRLRTAQQDRPPREIGLNRRGNIGFLHLGLFEHASGIALDPAKVIHQLREALPEASVQPEDWAAIELQQAETFFAQELQTEPQGPAAAVVRMLRRKAHQFGPSFGIAVPRIDADMIVGCVRPVGVTFLFDEPLKDELMARLLSFLRSLGVGKIETMSIHDRKATLLDDLHGPSDCASDAPELPWSRQP